MKNLEESLKAQLMEVVGACALERYKKIILDSSLSIDNKKIASVKATRAVTVFELLFGKQLEGYRRNEPDSIGLVKEIVENPPKVYLEILEHMDERGNYSGRFGEFKF